MCRYIMMIGAVSPTMSAARRGTLHHLGDWKVVTGVSCVSQSDSRWQEPWSRPVRAVASTGVAVVTASVVLFVVVVDVRGAVTGTCPALM